MNKINLIPILFLLSFIVLLYFDLPQLSKNKEIEKSILEQEKEIKMLKTETLALEKIAQRLAEHKDSVDKISSAIPDNFSAADILNFFHNTASRTGLILKMISPSQIAASSKNRTTSQENASTTSPLKKVKAKENYIMMTAQGNLVAFENFLKETENSSRMIEMEKLSIKDSGEGFLNFNLLLKVYSLN